MRTKLDQGQIGHFILCLSNIIFLCILRNIQKLLNHSVNNHSEPCCGIRLFLEVSYGAKTYGIQYMYNSLIST